MGYMPIRHSNEQTAKNFEINVYSHETRRIGTIARVYTDSEDGLGYYRAFSLIFKTAEQDTGRKLPWGHLAPMKNGIHRIKAVLVDEHGGQIKGLGRYLEEQDPRKEVSSHVLALVKTFTYNTTIAKLHILFSLSLCSYCP
jgi:hypothetical protein